MLTTDARLISSGRALRCAVLTLCALAFGACAAARGPDATRPRANEPAYPLILAASAERREQALGAWQALTQEQGLASAPQPELQTVTATISALPQGITLRLPKVEIASNAAESKDEATREALRRFITSAAPLLGVAAQDLSLVETKDAPDGTTLARYRQNPFPYPLRAEFGLIEIHFTADGHISALSSTALPDTERLARALTAQTQKLTAKDAETRVKGRAFSYPGISNSTLSYTVGPDEVVKARELVIYPQRRANDPAVLELHLAWELAVGRGDAPFLIYVDAVTGDIIAAAAQATQQTPAK